jgi:hypothetical protein
MPSLAATGNVCDPRLCSHAELPVLTHYGDRRHILN